jgi:membrane-associated phospholipid phosphatase
VTPGQIAVVALTHPLVLSGLALLVAINLAKRVSVRASLRFLASVGLAAVLAHGLKYVANDPRPIGGAIDALGSGWPSAHTAVAAAAAYAIWAALPRGREGGRHLAFATAVLVLGALAVALSRLYLGVHDVGDLAGGLVVGLAAGFALRARR